MRSSNKLTSIAWGIGWSIAAVAGIFAQYFRLAGGGIPAGVIFIPGGTLAIALAAYLSSTWSIGGPDKPERKPLPEALVWAGAFALAAAFALWGPAESLAGPDEVNVATTTGVGQPRTSVHYPAELVRLALSFPLFGLIGGVLTAALLKGTGSASSIARSIGSGLIWASATTLGGFLAVPGAYVLSHALSDLLRSFSELAGLLLGGGLAGLAGGLIAGVIGSMSPLPTKRAL